MTLLVLETVRVFHTWYLYTSQATIGNQPQFPPISSRLSPQVGSESTPTNIVLARQPLYISHHSTP